MAKRRKDEHETAPKGYQAVDWAGRLLPMGSPTVKATMDEIMADPATELILLVARRGDDVVMPILGVPSRDTLALLKTAVKAYQSALSARQGTRM